MTARAFVGFVMVQVVPHPETVAKRFLHGLLERALEEADLLRQLAESKGEEAEVSQFFLLTRFDCSTTDINRLVLRRRSLRQAGEQFQDPRKQSKIAA